MRRFVVNALAIVGALTVLGALAGFAVRVSHRGEFGTVMGPDDQPLAGVPIFLDRGSRGIERYLTDHAGRIRFPLADRDLARATWLICAPGQIPVVARDDPHDRSFVTYGYSRLTLPTWDLYRNWGWRGPIPHECPPAGAGSDSMLWAYRLLDHPGLAYSTQEPTWVPIPTTHNSARELPNDR